jgi:hypothetical protein
VKIACELFGCYEIDIPACGRFGADGYSGEFVQSGRFEPIFRLARRTRDAVSLRNLAVSSVTGFFPFAAFSRNGTGLADRAVT